MYKMIDVIPIWNILQPSASETVCVCLSADHFVDSEWGRSALHF